jgi:hypothetical protein
MTYECTIATADAKHYFRAAKTFLSRVAISDRHWVSQHRAVSIYSAAGNKMCNSAIARCIHCWRMATFTRMAFRIFESCEHVFSACIITCKLSHVIESRYDLAGRGFANSV